MKGLKKADSIFFVQGRVGDLRGSTPAAVPLQHLRHHVLQGPQDLLLLPRMVSATNFD